jgi:rod shape-determining protein MreC
MKGLNGKVSTAFLIILSIALLIFGRKNIETVERVKISVEGFFVPALDVIAYPIRGVDAGFEWVGRLVSAFNENEYLREENTRLRKSMIVASQVVIDNERLKKLLNIREGKVSIIAASRVVSDTASPFFRSTLINSGTEDGISKGQAAINEEGVVGRTMNVGNSSARVLLVTDINSRVPAKFSKNGINMILVGDNSRFPLLNFLPEGSDVEVGDIILTSGQGKVFPPDLLIGQVVRVSENGEVKVKLAANLNRLNYISILNYEIADLPVRSEKEHVNPKP